MGWAKTFPKYGDDIYIIIGLLSDIIDDHRHMLRSHMGRVNATITHVTTGARLMTSTSNKHTFQSDYATCCDLCIFFLWPFERSVMNACPKKLMIAIEITCYRDTITCGCVVLTLPSVQPI